MGNAILVRKGGIDVSDATAVSEQVLSGSSFFAGENDDIQVGTMPNRGAVNQALNAGGVYTIPEGYHNGQGKVSATNLASQTPATATAGQILSGQTAYVNGQKITGTMPNRGANNIILPVNGTATIPEGYHNGQGRVSQNLPIKGEQNFLPGTTNQTIWGGQYLSGNQTILGDPNLISNNIVKGKTIFGVTGNFIQPEPTVYYMQNGLAVPSLGSYRQIRDMPYMGDIKYFDSGFLYMGAGSTGVYNEFKFMTFSNPIDLTLHRHFNIQNAHNGHGAATFYLGFISCESLINASYDYLINRVINNTYGWTAVLSGSTGEYQLNTLNIEQLSGYYYIALGLRQYSYVNIKDIYLSY